ncbi:MAG: PEGA domain-containing protein [Ignavibacteriales bacterium]
MHHPYVGRVARALLIVAFAASSAACATITRGTKEDWAVQTDPVGAKVQTDHGYSCEPTPCTMKLPRKNEFQVTVTKAGYKTYSTRVTNGISGKGTAGLVGNAVVGGIIGIGVDAVSGATLDLHPNPLVVKLEPEAPAVASTDAAPAAATPAANAPAADAAAAPSGAAN